ncbi:MAG: cation:proton antiporter [Pseudomonadota bacterium]
MVLDQAATMLVVCSAAAVLPGLSRVLCIPSPVVEIFFGVLLGKSLFNLEPAGEWLPFLAELGFLILMLHAGMEIDFRALSRQRPRRLLVHLLVFAVTAGMALGCSLLMGHGVFMALVLSTTSLGLVLPGLKDAGLGRGAFAQTILIAATLADFLTLLGITVYNLWFSHGLTWRLLLPLPIFTGFGVLFYLGRLWAWWHPRIAERLLMSDDPSEQGVRFSMALLFLLVGISELAGLEPVLGAFMGGCVLAFVFREKQVLEQKLSALGFGFLIPIFFIHVGMQFDVRNVLGLDHLLFSGLLLTMALAVKLLPSLLYTLAGLEAGMSLRAGLLLSSRLSLIVAAASIGLAQGFITPALKDAIVLLALLTALLGPTLFKLSMRGLAPPPTAQPKPPRPPRADLEGT